MIMQRLLFEFVTVSSTTVFKQTLCGSLKIHCIRRRIPCINPLPLISPLLNLFFFLPSLLTNMKGKIRKINKFSDTRQNINKKNTKIPGEMILNSISNKKSSSKVDLWLQNLHASMWTFFVSYFLSFFSAFLS